MAEIQLVEASLRDGNQMPVGRAPASTPRRSLQIAPVMDRVGFRALDFTTRRTWASRCAHTARTRGSGSG